MIRKKFLAVMLTASMVIGTVAVNNSNTNAAEATTHEKNQLQKTISNLTKGYSEYYNISNVNTTLCSSGKADGNIENTYLLEMEAVLKADSVEDMDYYKGISDYYSAAKTGLSKINSQNNKLRMSVLSSEQSDIYEELEEYIGKEQNLVFYLKETYPENNETDKEILFENGVDYVSWEVMLPSSHDELRINGYERMADMDYEYASVSEKANIQNAKAAYSITKAVNYMTKYTSNPTSCNVCGKGCSSKVDTTKYNPNYKHYVSNGSHVDCANYVSQALHAGGISTDNTWKAASTAWVNVSKLTSYMTSNGHWKKINYKNVKNGDIVSFTSYSHVVMITSYDGTTYKFSGHTNDRKNATISINSSTASSYNFYRVS